MQLRNYNLYFFLIILFVISVLFLWVLSPFFKPLFAAMALGVVFWPLNKFFLKITGRREAVSSLLTSFLAFLSIVIPISITFILLGREVNQIYNQISVDENFYERNIDYLTQFWDNSFLGHYVSAENFLDKEKIAISLKNSSHFLLSLLQKTYYNVAGFIFNLIVMFFALYYLLVDGKNFFNKIVFLSPLRDEYEKIILKKFFSVTRATIKGTLIIGIIQGFLGGAVFAIAGISSPVIWGLVMTLLSIIPLAGSAFIWLPAGVILLVIGKIWQGIFILSAGTLIISTIDNFLRPKLVGKDTQIHPLLVFFSTLGGLALFGLVGFIIGPVIMALFLVFWEIYAYEFKTQLKKYNA